MSLKLIDVEMSLGFLFHFYFQQLFHFEVERRLKRNVPTYRATFTDKRHFIVNDSEQ